MLALRTGRQLGLRAGTALVAPSSALLQPTTHGARNFWYDVRSSASREVAKPIAANQKLEKTWTLTGSKPLDKLKLSTPGLTFISIVDNRTLADEFGVDPSRAVAFVRATSNSSEVLERIEVDSRFGYRTLVDFDVPFPYGSTSSTNDFLLTEILLPPTSLLRNIAISQFGDTIIDGSALATGKRSFNATKMVVSGDRRVFIISQAEQGVFFGNLQLATAVGSQVHFRAPRVSVKNKLNIAVAGGSTVTFDSSAFHADVARLFVAGGGNVHVNAEKVSVGMLRSCIAGGGKIAVTAGEGEGRCGWQRIDVAGYGNVDMSDVESVEARVRVAGDGAVTVRASEYLGVQASGHAAVRFVPPEPRLVQCLAIPDTVRPLDPSEQAARPVISSVTVPSRADAFDEANKVVVDPSWVWRSHWHWNKWHKHLPYWDAHRWHRGGRRHWGWRGYNRYRYDMAAAAPWHQQPAAKRHDEEA